MARNQAYARSGVLALVMAASGTTFAEPYVVPDAWTDLPAAQVVTGGTLRFSMFEAPRTFNPLQSLEVNFVVSLNTAAGLGAAVLGWLRPDDLTLEPRAAESWTVSDDGLRVEVTLRPELRWSDGEPITAQDYLVSYQLQVKPETSARGPYQWMIGDELITVTATGPHALVIQFPAPDRLAMQAVAGLYPLPDHVFGEAFRSGGAEAVNALWDASTPPSELVFSGFMLVKELLDGERLTLERNPYFGDWTVDAVGQPLPYLDGVTFTFLQPDGELNLFLAGELDSIWVTSLDDLGVINAAIANHGLEAEAYESVYPIEATSFFAFNWNLASDPYKQGLLRDRDFRRAMAHLVDRQALIDLVHAGAAFPLTGSIHPAYEPWFDATVTAPAFDPDAAVSLLAGLGFTRRDADGYLIDAEGRRAGFTITVLSGDPVFEQVPSIFADTAREVGVDVRLQPLAFSLIVDILDVDGDDRAFEAIYIGLTPAEPAWPFWEGLYSCTGAFHIYNKSGACLSPSENLIAELARRGRATLDDAEALRIAREIQALEMDLGAMIFTVTPAAHLVRSARVAGGFPPELWSPRVDTGWLFMNSVR